MGRIYENSIFGKVGFGDLWICGKWCLGHSKNLEFSTSYVEQYLDCKIHNFSYVELYMDDTIHISPMFTYIWTVRSTLSPMLMLRGGVAGGRGGRGWRGRRRRRQRRRRRRRPNNSAIWPDPWTITPRDHISCSGSIPHFDIACPKAIEVRDLIQIKYVFQ